MKKNKQYTAVEFERELKKAHFKRKVADKAAKVANWVSNNKELVIVALPFVVKGTASVCKFAGKNINLHKQERIKNLYCYDPSLGHYWHLKRDLTNSEWVQVDRRKQNGERLADILSDMRVLK